MNAAKMKAISALRYGSPDVLTIQEFNIPTPKPNEVLIKNYASAITAADTMLRKATPFISRFFLGLTKPRNPIPGTGFAGEIVEVGAEVTQFKVGDKVFGETTTGFAAHAQYVSISEDGVITTLPTNISYEEAAPVCDGALTSYNFLKEIGQLKAGQKILINGASGSLGSAAVQLAKYMGAEVTGVCSTTNVAFVKALGADYVIDYTKTDFTQTGKTYDLIYDSVGKSSFGKSKRALTPTGQFLSPVLKLSTLFQMLWTSKSKTKKVKFAATGLLPEPILRKMLEEVKVIMEEGHLKTFIDKRYPLEQTPLAHEYVDTGRKRGNVIINLI